MGPPTDRALQRQVGSPLYPPPVQRSRCRTAVVTVFRVVVALLALVMVALTIAGQVVPFCVWSNYKEEKTYSVWRETEIKYKKYKTEQEAREENSGEKAFAILSVICSVAACVLCLVFVGLWTRHEQERRREVRAYRRAQGYADEMQAIDRANSHDRSGEAGGLAVAPTRHAFYGDGAELYERERQRQRVDRDVGIAAFSLLVGAAVTSLVTLVLMAKFYIEEVSDEIREKKNESAATTAGFGIFIFAVIVGVVAFIVLALPFATDLYLCCGVQVEKVYPAQRLSRSDSEERDETEKRRVPPQFAYAEPGYGNDAAHVQRNHNATHYHPNHYQVNNISELGGAAAPPGQMQAPLAGQPAAVVPLRDEQLAAPRAAAAPQRLYVNVPPSNGQQAAGARYQDTQVHNSSPPPAAAREAPQPYVPTMVGTYPDALPGPTSMEHVTMHHVPQNGETHGAAFPVTQAAWRGSDRSSNYSPTGSKTAQDTGDLKAEKLFGSPVKKL